MQKTQWVILWTSQNTQEVVPEFDIIDHKHKFTCLCNPKVEALLDEEAGTFVWRTVHNSFDEYLDDDDLEPYKGL